MISHTPDISESDLRDLLRSVDGPVDIEKVLDQWKAIQGWLPISHHYFPKPVWARRPFDHSIDKIWENLEQVLDQSPAGHPLSIYIHVPFCNRRCGFCDLYSHALSRNKMDIEDAFVSRLMREIELWSSFPNLASRPVTTVHMGGGTPNLLRPDSFARIIEVCRRRFGINADTEWALESTSRLLTDEHLVRLRELGFTRIHIGVQTLDDKTRKHIGRIEDSATLLLRLKCVMSSGFVTSADILYGLPEQTLAELVATLTRLADTGIHGFSMYQLQTNERNRRFMERWGADKQNLLLNYILFQVGDHYLQSKGYRKNFFTHFALPSDRNLYYRHVLRGEDLLALGPTADGVFGNYIYRHFDYDKYMTSHPPALQGGSLETPTESQLRPVAAQLMTGLVSENTFMKLDLGPLLDLWQAGKLLEPSAMAPGHYEITANGSWFMTQMVDQTLHRLQAHAGRHR